MESGKIHARTVSTMHRESDDKACEYVRELARGGCICKVSFAKGFTPFLPCQANTEILNQVKIPQEGKPEKSLLHVDGFSFSRYMNEMTISEQLD